MLGRKLGQLIEELVESRSLLQIARPKVVLIDIEIRDLRILDVLENKINRNAYSTNARMSNDFVVVVVVVHLRLFTANRLHLKQSEPEEKENERN